MRCRLLLAVAGLLVSVAVTQAQTYAPSPLAPTPLHAVSPAALPTTIDAIVPVSARSVATGNCAGCAGPVVAYGDGCAAPTAHKAHSRKLLIGGGTINPVSCGCLASEKTFVFGSCKQFFNPTQTCNTGCNGCWPVDRRTPCQGVTSYTNR